MPMGATEVGVILGTASYMPPEQASGNPVDKRADIWSFGVVLWEMLNGKRLFHGSDVTHTLADVLRAPIDFSRIPAGPLRQLVERCLDRDVKTRLRDIGEARVALERPPEPVTAAKPAAQPVLAWLVAAACALIAGAVAVIHYREIPAPRDTIQAQLALPEGVSGLEFSLSPDGHLLAISGSVTGKRTLWLRPLPGDQMQAVPGSEGADYPFWSPDSRYVGFFADGKLKKVLASGGPPQTLADALNGRGATWNRDNIILFSSDDGGGFSIKRVAAGGGVAELEWKPPNGIARYPVFLPDDRHFLYVVTRASAQENGIYFGSLGGAERRRILGDESSVVFAAGNLLFIRGDTLIAQAFDPDSGQTAGDPTPVGSGVSTTSNVIYAPVTAAGGDLLIYQSGGAATGQNQLTWLDRAGKRLGTMGPANQDFEPALSPDGKSVAFMRLSSAGSDIWLGDVARSTQRRFTSNPSFERTPVWSPQGDRITFGTNREAGIFNLSQQPLDGKGNEAALLITPFRKLPKQWTRDGAWLVYTEVDPKTKDDIWLLPMEGAKPGKPTVFLHSEFAETYPQVSPDGHWMSYTSDESGRNEVYVREFPGGANPQKISTTGGQEARWKSDNKEIYYVSADGKMMAVPLRTVGPALQVSPPQTLFPIPSLAHYASTEFAYDLTPDGGKFLLALSGPTVGASNLRVSVNWNSKR